MAEVQTSTPLGGALNIDMQSGLPISSRLKPFDTSKMSSKDVLAKEQELMPLQRKADQALEAATAKVDQDVAIAKAESTSNYAKDINDKLEEKKKKQAEFPYPEFHPTEDNIKSLGSLFSVMSVVGLMLGGAGKLGAMNALGSMTGMMKGWQEGRADLFKKEKESFDKEFAKVKQFHSDLQQAFDEYMKLAPVNREAAMYAKEQFIRQAGSSSILAAQMDKGNLDGVAKLLTSAKASIQHAEDQLQQKKEADARIGIEKERLYLERERLEFEKGKKKIASLGGNATLEKVIGKTAATDKIADTINQNAAALSRIDSLLTRVSDPEIILGVKGKLNGIAEKAKSLFGEQGEINSDQINTLINGAIDPTDKNAVILKDALYSAFEIERAAQGGRLTVQMMKVGGSALNPTSYTKEGYISVLGGRRQTLINNLKAENLDEDDQQKLISHYSQQQGPIPAPAPVPAPAASPLAIQKERADAQKAIEDGADPEQVRSHFKTRTGLNL